MCWKMGVSSHFVHCEKEDCRTTVVVVIYVFEFCWRTDVLRDLEVRGYMYKHEEGNNAAGSDVAWLPLLNAPNTCPMQTLYANPGDDAIYPFPYPSFRRPSIPNKSRNFVICLPSWSVV